MKHKCDKKVYLCLRSRLCVILIRRIYRLDTLLGMCAPRLWINLSNRLGPSLVILVLDSLNCDCRNYSSKEKCYV